MGATNPTYPIYEVAVATGSHPEIGRIQEGDIVACRPPRMEFGKKERQHVIWLRLEGLEEQWMPLLEASEQENGVIYDKRRYCIPLGRLKALVPTLDLIAARDWAEIYQPFFTFDESTGMVITAVPPFHVSGLVFDKHTMEYL